MELLTFGRVLANVFGRLLLRLPVLAVLATVLVCFSPGLTSDERSLDLRLSSASVESLRGSTAARPLEISVGYLKGMFLGDLGYSSALSAPVRDLLLERAPVTLTACIFGVLVGWSVAVLLCSAANLLRLKIVGTCGLSFATAVLCIPSVLIGLLAVYWTVPLGIAMAVVIFPRIYHYVWRVLSDAERAPHMILAQASGISVPRAFWAHLLPPVKPEILAVLGTSVTTALGATVPLEVITDTPGLGQLAWKATLARDLALLLSVTLLMASISTVSTACTDLADSALRSRGA